MKKILILFTALILASCVATKKQREKFLRNNCVLSSSSQIKDSTSKKETIIYDTDYVFMPGPIRYLPSPCEKLCDSLGNLKPFKQESRHNGIKQSLESVGNVLVQKCDVDSLLQVNTTLKTEIEHFRKETTKEQVHDNCKLQHLSDKDIFWRMVGIRLSILIAIYIGLRLLKLYIRNIPWLAWLAKLII